jgi:hypothetical protein
LETNESNTAVVKFTLTAFACQASRVEDNETVLINDFVVDGLCLAAISQTDRAACLGGRSTSNEDGQKETYDSRFKHCCQGQIEPR